MEPLAKIGNLSCCFSTHYQPAYLEPVAQFVLWKLSNNWDDYNELYHACRFFEQAKQEAGIRIHSHLLFREEHLTGCVFFALGKIATIENKHPVEQEEKSLLLKYFHIKEKGKGLGSQWLSEVIFPYYRSGEFETIYASSSHPQSFSLYEKYGRLISTYHGVSDNKLHRRTGHCYAIQLQEHKHKK